MCPVQVMSGNQFIRRCKQLLVDKSELCIATAGEKEQVILGRAAVVKFTALQCVCLGQCAPIAPSIPPLSTVCC